MNPTLRSSLLGQDPLLQFRFCAPLIQELKPQVLWIECYKGMQVPSFQVVGLPGPEISEARERIRAAVESSGLEFPGQKVLINLSPANVKKQGTGLDLSMALSVLLTEVSKDSQSSVVPPLPIQTVCAWGELSLNGDLRNSGHEFRALVSALHGQADVLVLPKECEQRVADHQEYLDILNVSEIRSDLPENNTLQLLRRRGWPRIVFATNLGEAYLDLWTNGLSSQQAGSSLPDVLPQSSSQVFLPPRSLQAKEDEGVKRLPQLLPLSSSIERILGVSLSGAHHLLLLGARGAGKSQAFEWIPYLLPKPSSGSQIHNRLATENQADVPILPWIRRVGQQVKAAALVGGITSRSAVRPGEFTLAHGGVLLADEFPEWSRDARESLREPLERGKVSLTRANGSIELPAQFIFLGNGNLCPCGGVPKEWSSLHARLSREGGASSRSERGSHNEIQTPICRCTDLEQQRYRARLSGPVLDRMDLVVRVLPEFRRNTIQSLSLEDFTRKIQAVRTSLESKYGGLPGTLSGSQLEFVLNQLPHFQQALREVQFTSLRSRHKCVRVALTLAEWDSTHSEPGIAHLREAQFYRAEAVLSDAHRP